MDSLAYLRDQSQVFGPGRVNVAQRDGALGLERDIFSETITQLGVASGKSFGAQPQLLFAGQRAHTPTLQRAALLFDQRGVAPKRLSYLVILSLHNLCSRSTSWRTAGCSIGSSPGAGRIFGGIRLSIPKRAIKWSSRLTKKRDVPGSP